MGEKGNRRHGNAPPEEISGEKGRETGRTESFATASAAAPTKKTKVKKKDKK